MGCRNCDGLFFLSLGGSTRTIAQAGHERKTIRAIIFIVKGSSGRQFAEAWPPVSVKAGLGDTFIVQSNAAMKEVRSRYGKAAGPVASVWHSNGVPLLSCGRLARSLVSPDGHLARYWSGNPRSMYAYYCRRSQAFAGAYLQPESFDPRRIALFWK